MLVFQVIRPGQEPNFVMRAPGALHHARFLASALYILKLSLLADDLPRGVLTVTMRQNVDRMAQYIALFHGSWFLQARVAPIAPRLDVQLWEDMCIYQVYILYMYTV